MTRHQFVQLLAASGLALLLACSQVDKKKIESSAGQYAAFDEMLVRLRQNAYDSSLAPPVIFRGSVFRRASAEPLEPGNFELHLTKHPLTLRRQVVRLANPFGLQTTPLAPSVIYQQHLTTLFNPGWFACYKLSDFSRDTQLEKKLNTQKFERHWVLNQQLIGWRRGQAYSFDSTSRKWQPYTQSLPFRGRPKLFEDERFVCTMDCQGEFGGNLYFFDKQMQCDYRTAATCAASVWKDEKGYHVLASLAHMDGSAYSGVIADPRQLPIARVPRKSAQNWRDEKSSESTSKLVKQETFSFYGLIMLGALRWHRQTLYIVQWRDTTFLATILGQVITIVDPLFNDSMDTDDAIAVNYPDSIALANLIGYGSEDEEVACLLLNNEQLTKVEWMK